MWIALAIGLTLGLTFLAVNPEHWTVVLTAEAGGLGLASVVAALASRHLESAYLEFIETMAQALDARDPYTAGHSIRVAAYAYAIAREVGLPEREAAAIRFAAQLHDIGKIGIPDAVLQKPGMLTLKEYGLIKLHPQIGRRILEKVGRFKKFLSVVELHHERHDGTGYPYGLSGTRIPLAARIVHVADAFDAMLTNRSYRTALTLEAAIEEVRVNAGRDFDPAVAEAFLKLVAEGRLLPEMGQTLWTGPRGALLEPLAAVRN